MSQRHAAPLQAHIKRPFQRRLLRWYAAQQRDLPWRRTTDPYAIWVAEVMLQQTTVRTVTPYYERFLRRFPTMRDLAAAPLDEVLGLWAGLGYYARARNLHRAAQEVMGRFGGEIPNTPQTLQTLPGIGRYTAGALCSIAFNKETPLLDGNVTRVLCRIFHITDDPRNPANQRRLWGLAEQLIPRGKARAFNQAMMELGALVCTPDAPQCDACPLNALCAARRLGAQSRLPEATRQPTVKAIEDVAAVIRRDGRCLIVQRPLGGLWGGLWEFPRSTRRRGEAFAACARRALHEALGVEVAVGKRLATLQQSVEHRRITLHCFACTLKRGKPRALGCVDWRWATPDEMLSLPISSAQRRVVETLES